MRTIELSTIFGILSALGLVTLAISVSGNLNDFVDVPSIIIVILGTSLITIACFSIREVFSSIGLIFKMSATKLTQPNLVALSIMKVSDYAYKKGILALESIEDLKIDSPLFRKGLSLVIDGERIEAIDRIMTQEIMSAQENYNIMISIIKKAGEVAPSMGLIGTLIGLVQMLGSLNDVKLIGPAMAVALLTTFYGAILAYMILFPLSSKLERNARDELLNANLYLKSLISIARKENPRQLEYMLNSILPPDKRIIYYKN